MLYALWCIDSGAAERTVHARQQAPCMQQAPCRCGQHRERASAARPRQVERLASEVEAVNPNKASLSSPLVNGKWRLLYTTSSSILGTSRPPFLRPGGDIYQTIGAPRLHGLPCCPQRQKP